MADISKYEKMSTKDKIAEVKALSKRANVRLKAIEQRDLTGHPKYERAMKDLGTGRKRFYEGTAKYIKGGKETNYLNQQLAVLSDFLEGSTITEIKKYYNERLPFVSDAVGLSFDALTNADRKEIAMFMGSTMFKNLKHDIDSGLLFEEYKNAKDMGMTREQILTAFQEFRAKNLDANEVHAQLIEVRKRGELISGK